MLNLLTELYDSDPNGWYMEHPFKKSTLSGGTISIHNPTFNFLGCTTPETLMNQIISSKEIDSGFASRVFFVHEKSSSGKASLWREAAADTRAKEIEKDLVHDLKIIASKTGQFAISSIVRDRQNEFVARNESDAMNPSHTRLRSFYGRKPTHIIKLAQIMCLADSDGMCIELSHWEAAYELICGIEQDLFVLFGGVGQGLMAPLIYKVWEVSRRQENFTFKFILDHFWHEASRSHLIDALVTLITMKKISSENHKGLVVYKVIDKSPLK
jgi:hypothetical protein